jgi:hypothetical protein
MLPARFASTSKLTRGVSHSRDDFCGRYLHRLTSKLKQLLSFQLFSHSVSYELASPT